MSNRDRSHVGFLRWFVWHVLRLVWLPLAAVVFRPRVTGVRGLPDSGYLLLANHTAVIDTLWVAAPTGRLMHFMTSAARFRNPNIGRVLTFFNCFPKTVGSSDPSATATVKELVDAGQIVQIMPEGTRTWDGRLNPIRSSIGALVQRHHLPVVLCRVQTGHLLWPRWAKLPRWIPLVIDYSELMTWPEDADPDQVWQDIIAGLTLDPPALSGAVASRSRAEGLPTYLWACPVCFARATTAAGNSFDCRECGRRWTVGLDLRLEGEPAMSVAEAWDAVQEQFGTPPRLSEQQILQGELLITAFNTGAPVHEGPVELVGEGLRGQGWSVDYTAIKSVYLDAGNVVVLRMKEGPQLKLAPAKQSTWMWYHFLSLHLEASRA